MSVTSPARVRSWTPTPEQAAYLHATEAASQFLHNLPDDLRRRFAGEWVAAKDGEIVASAPTRVELQAVLGDQFGSAVVILRLEKGVTIRWRRPS